MTLKEMKPSTSSISRNTVLLPVLIGLLNSIVSSSAASISDLSYDTSGETVTIVSCDQNASGALEIPSTIDGKRVSSIGPSAFAQCGRLRSITIPNSVTSIGARAFFFCSRLTSITIPNSVTSLGTGAFALCESLPAITIPDSITSISDGTFGECYSLRAITIPNSVTSIGDRAFANCIHLASIAIPHSVTSLGSEPFHGCASLTRIVFMGDAPTSLDKIPLAPEFVGVIPLEPPPDAIVTVQASATGFGATFRGLPVVIEEAASRITKVRIDVEGNLILTLDRSNNGIKLLYSPQLQSDFKEISETATRGENEILIRSTTPELQGSHGFFRLSN